MDNLNTKSDTTAKYTATQIEKYLRRSILATSPRDSLPSVRSLMSRFNVGQAKVQAVLDRLEKEEYIERKSRLGVFRTDGDTLSKMVPVFDFVTCSKYGDVRQTRGFLSNLLHSISSELKRRGHSLRVHQVLRGQPIAAYQELAAHPQVRACLLFGLHAPEVLAAFDKQFVSCLSLFPTVEFEAAGNCIHTPLDMVNRLMVHLSDIGHTNIAFLGRSYPHSPRYLSLHRQTEYYRFMAEHGIRVHPHWVCDSSGDETVALAALNRMFRETPTPSAIIMPSVSLQSAYRYLRQRGMRIGHDVALAGIDENLVCQQLNPVPTRIGVKYGETARVAVSTLRNLLLGKDAPAVQSAPCYLAIGQSTAIDMPADENRGDEFYA